MKATSLIPQIRIIGLWILKWKKLYVFKWIFNSWARCIGPVILSQVHHFLFCMNYIRRKKLELWWKQSSPIFPAYLWKVRPRAWLGPSCRPSGQLGSQANWPAKELACLTRGACYLREGISRENLEAAGTSGEKVVRRSYQAWLLPKAGH